VRGLAGCLVLLGAAGATGSCGSSVSPSNSSLHGSVSDPAGDSTPDATVAVSPDLVAATIDVTDGVLTVTMSFAPGTLSRSTTFWIAHLDTDENPSTGAVLLPGTDTLLGIDYIIQGQGSTAQIFHRDTAPAPGQPAPGTFVSNAIPTFPMSDTVSVSTSLFVLGSDDGRLKFRVTARPSVDGTTPAAANDYMPDLGLPPGVVR
jgi:hypothetical protein